MENIVSEYGLEMGKDERETRNLGSLMKLLVIGV